MLVALRQETLQCIELDLSQQRVELASKAYFESLGWNVFYAENALLNSLLGLTFWDAIFAPIEGLHEFV